MFRVQDIGFRVHRIVHTWFFSAMQGDAALLADGLVCVEILMTKCHKVRLGDLLLAAYQAWRKKARSIPASPQP